MHARLDFFFYYSDLLLFSFLFFSFYFLDLLFFFVSFCFPSLNLNTACCFLTLFFSLAVFLLFLFFLFVSNLQKQLVLGLFLSILTQFFL